MVNSLDYHPCPSRLASRIHPFIFLLTSLGFSSLSRMLVKFSLKLLYSTICGTNFQIYRVHIPRKNAVIPGIFTHAPPHSKFVPKFLSSRPRQKEITQSARQDSFENLFPPTGERGGGNYDLLYQNSVRKYEDDLEH